jgi:hypothetical protein
MCLNEETPVFLEPKSGEEFSQKGVQKGFLKKIEFELLWLFLHPFIQS